MTNFKRNQKGFSLIELLIVVAIILIIAAIAIPNLLQARVAANEASAVSSLRTINTAQITYVSSYPSVGYASTLASLSGTSCTPPDETAACLIDNQLSTGTKSGYTFTVSSAGTPISQYLVAGSPVSGNGNRSFCTTESAVLYVDPTGSPITDHDACQTLNPIQ